MLAGFLSLLLPPAPIVKGMVGDSEWWRDETYPPHTISVRRAGDGGLVKSGLNVGQAGVVGGLGGG